MIKKALLKSTLFIFILVSIIVFTESCRIQQDVNNIKPKGINKSSQYSWNKKNNIILDNSVDTDQLKEQIFLNKKAWESAFNFLNKSNFRKLKNEKYELLAGAFATVSQYTTKDTNSTYYEVHRKYIDIQYVVNGREYIGLTKLTNMISPIIEYDEKKDIEFFKIKDTHMLLADSTHLFIFFPSNAHKPCIKIDKVTQIKKVVVKIPFITN